MTELLESNIEFMKQSNKDNHQKRSMNKIIICNTCHDQRQFNKKSIIHLTFSFTFSFRFENDEWTLKLKDVCFIHNSKCETKRQSLFQVWDAVFFYFNQSNSIRFSWITNEHCLNEIEMRYRVSYFKEKGWWDLIEWKHSINTTFTWFRYIFWLKEWSALWMKK